MWRRPAAPRAATGIARMARLPKSTRVRSPFELFLPNEETTMTFKHTLGALALALAASGACAQLTVGVSWSNFQEERWKTDEAAMKAQLEKLGAKYVSADAGGSPEKQLADVDGLISKGATALIILAMDKDAIVPALAKAKAKNLPVVAYDRLIEQPGVFYITFDNK